MNILRSVLGGIAALILIAAVGGIIAVNVSPKPFIFLPKEDKRKKYPTVIWTHGGSFVAGDKSGTSDWATSEEVNQASTSRQVTANFPPTFLSDGNSDSFEQQAKHLQKSLEDKHVPVETLFFLSTKQVPHEYQFQLDTQEAKECFETG
ncbi:hypothetical protein [Paenibacillus sp. 1001270B_150601_E10]|uniref:hypothetical protein n=1 Tax=Paenibacillus sp. 1001270B_150601_E10 TaxID=2787079 RepID=UPI00189E226D|nr:hypothetical protein [Paenibacillus sp. 1001270B_150601_E10]